MRDGVIADFIATEEMLRQFIARAKTMLGFRRPRILICVPAGATPVERRAVYETAMSAGARRVYLIEEPVAASLGAGLPIDAPTAFMVVDIGGGTTDIAVLARGQRRPGALAAGWPATPWTRPSCATCGASISLVIGEMQRRAHQDRGRHGAGAAQRAAGGDPHQGPRPARGPHEKAVLGPQDMAEALSGCVADMAEFIQRALEDLPPEAAAEVTRRGIVLTGGGALLDRLDVALEQRIGVKFVVPDTPMHCVIRGSAAVLESLAEREHLLIGP